MFTGTSTGASPPSQGGSGAGAQPSTNASRHVPSLFSTSAPSGDANSSGGGNDNNNSAAINRSGDISRIDGTSSTKEEQFISPTLMSRGGNASSVTDTDEGQRRRRSDLDRIINASSGGVSSQFVSPSRALGTSSVGISPPSPSQPLTRGMSTGDGKSNNNNASTSSPHDFAATATRSDAYPYALPAGSGRATFLAPPPPGSIATAAPNSHSRAIAIPSGIPGASPSPSSTIDYADIEQKQSELRHAVEYRVTTLEHTVVARDEELAQLRSQLRKMEEDYQFNYNLIGERDAALEEAAGQLQRLYRELKQLTNDAATMEERIASTETQNVALQSKLRKAEEEREEAGQNVRAEFATKEKRLAEAVKSREAELEAQKQRLHEEYVRKAQTLEQSQSKLETKVEEAHKALEASRAQCRKAEEKVSLLQIELQDRERQLGGSNAAAREAETRAQSLEARFAESHAQLGRSLAGVEETVRAESHRAAKLELEKASLQAQLVETDERLQYIKQQKTEDASRAAREVESLRASYTAAQTAAAEQERRWREAEQALKLSLTTKTSTVDALERDVRGLREELAQVKQALSRAQTESSKWHAEATHSSAEAQRWKEEEATTAERARKEASVAEEKQIAVDRQLQEATGDLERQRRKVFEIQERAQSEVARLTRELHASEAARRALEDQYHLSQDERGQGQLLHALRVEKETLERRVMELERTNGEIRAQVANFTLELQNDPLIKSAKETQRKVVELQQELLTARQEAQSMKDSLKTREDEAARYQMELMRAQLMLSSETGGAAVGSGLPSATVAATGFGSTAYPTGASSISVTNALQRQQQQLREEYALLRQSYEDMGRELERERRNRRSRRHHQRTASTSSNSIGTSKQNRHTSSERGSECEEDYDIVKRTRGSRRRQSQKGRVRSPAAPPALPLPVAARNAGGGNADYLLQESEVWRHKCLQLEQHLRVLLRERDQLSKELSLAQQDIRGLAGEKQSLLDLNSLLKAQLREAYRTAFEVNSAAPVAPAFAVTAGVAASSGAERRERSRGETNGHKTYNTVNSNSSGHMPSAEDVAAAVSLLQRLEESGVIETGAKESRLSSPSRHGGGLAVDHVRITPSSSSVQTATAEASSAAHRSLSGAISKPRRTGERGGDAASRQEQQRRLASLDDEIGDLKNQIASTMRGSGGDVSVVRKGGAAVRHYGYQ